MKALRWPKSAQRGRSHLGLHNLLGVSVLNDVQSSGFAL